MLVYGFHPYTNMLIAALFTHTMCVDVLDHYLQMSEEFVMNSMKSFCVDKFTAFWQYNLRKMKEASLQTSCIWMLLFGLYGV